MAIESILSRESNRGYL